MSTESEEVKKIWFKIFKAYAGFTSFDRAFLYISFLLRGFIQI